MTIEDIIRLPSLDTTLVAGRTGSRRAVKWAHSCEVPAPWEWLDHGDLLMTNGYSFPASADEQVAFLRALAAAGAAGVAIGEGREAPPLTEAAVTFANETGFPILSTAYGVPFSAISRAVAAGNSREEQARLMRTIRLYDRLREAVIEGLTGNALIERLGSDLRCELRVLDPIRGIEILSDGRALPDAASRAVVEAVAGRRDRLPALTRVEVDDVLLLVVPVQSRRPAVLVARYKGDATPSLSLLQHAATIAALQVERLTSQREQERRLGAELFAGLVDGRLDDRVAQHELATRSLDKGPLVIVACLREELEDMPGLHQTLTDRAIPHLILRRETTLVLLLLPAQREAIAALREDVADGARLGVSDPFEGAARMTDAVREAQWALAAAEREGNVLIHYGEGAPLFLPRTLSETERIVRSILGPLLNYDREHRSELVKSLKVFLEENRSWLHAAKTLHIHKQTLVYRIRRVEELTGRRLDNTADVAELWLALRAHELSSEKGAAGAAAHYARPRCNARATVEAGFAVEATPATESKYHGHGLADFPFADVADHIDKG